jgi:hypothetical protein
VAKFQESLPWNGMSKGSNAGVLVQRAMRELGMYGCGKVVNIKMPVPTIYLQPGMVWTIWLVVLLIMSDTGSLG